MPNKTTLFHDRQFWFVLAIWIFVISGSLMKGISMPTSQIANVWPAENPSSLFVFALVGPIVLILLNHYFPAGRGSLWMEWPQRLTDHFFGAGSALSFWRRLKPLFLIGFGALIQGCTGYFIAMNGAATKGAVVFSVIFICFGVGFSVAACLERLLLNSNTSA